MFSFSPKSSHIYTEEQIFPSLGSHEDFFQVGLLRCWQKHRISCSCCCCSYPGPATAGESEEQKLRWSDQSQGQAHLKDGPLEWQPKMHYVGTALRGIWSSHAGNRRMSNKQEQCGRLFLMERGCLHSKDFLRELHCNLLFNGWKKLTISLQLLLPSSLLLGPASGSHVWVLVWKGILETWKRRGS